MTFTYLRENNVDRCNKYLHPLEDWTPVDWSNAMAGESGEACNITKKMKRLEKGMIGQMNKEEDNDIEVLIKKLKDELADVVIYADLLAARMGFSLDDAIRSKFNRTSHEHEKRNNLPHMTLPRL